MNNNGISSDLFVWITIATITILLSHFGINNAYSQSVSTMNNSTAEQHAEHIFDNLIISEHIPLAGQLSSGDYILLMDFTPFVTSVEGHSHIALKVPCNDDGSPKVTIGTGIAPNLNILNIGNAIINGTIDGKDIVLSAEGSSCLYRAELPNSISDIALVNTSNRTLNFDEGGYYSVTVSVHGTEYNICHLRRPEQQTKHHQPPTSPNFFLYQLTKILTIS